MSRIESLAELASVQLNSLFAGGSAPCHLTFAQRILSTNTQLIVCQYSLTAPILRISRSTAVVEMTLTNQRMNVVDAFDSDAWRRRTSLMLPRAKFARTENVTSLHT